MVVFSPENKINNEIDKNLANLLYNSFFYVIIIVGVEGFHTKFLKFIKNFYILEDFQNGKC